MSVTSTVRPGNWNLAIAQAAAMPNATFSGTAIAATVTVRRMAASASGSRNEARYAATPLRSASTNTAASGRTRNRPRKASTTMVRAARVAAVSVVTGRQRSAASASGAPRSGMAEPPAGPGLEEVDGKQRGEGHRQHDRRDHGRAGVVVFFEFDND